MDELILDKKISQINYIDDLFLIVYVAVILIILRRATGLPEYGYYFFIRFILNIVLLMICLFKICFYMKSDLFYSIFSILLLLYSSFLYFSQLEFSIFNYFLYSHNTFAIIMLIIGAKNIDFDRIVRSFLVTTSCFAILRVFGTLTGWMPYSFVESKSGIVINFGFKHRNMFPILCLFISLALVYVKRYSRFVFLYLLMIVGFTMYLYVNARSSTSTVLVFATVLHQPNGENAVFKALEGLLYR